MKATLNIVTRKVTLKYDINKEDIVPPEEGDSSWEVRQKDLSSETVTCTQTIYFDDLDEWAYITLLDGRVIGVHFDYSPTTNFSSREEWLHYILQAYEDKSPNLYDQQLIESITLDII
jgi:hypothetical protein